jgi:hypothetical protein
MDGDIFAAPFGGFWILSLTRQKQLLGYWSSGLIAWVPNTAESDLTIWATAEAATTYYEKNRKRMLSAQVVGKTT